MAEEKRVAKVAQDAGNPVPAISLNMRGPTKVLEVPEGVTAIAVGPVSFRADSGLVEVPLELAAEAGRHIKALEQGAKAAAAKLARTALGAEEAKVREAWLVVKAAMERMVEGLR